MGAMKSSDLDLLHSLSRPTVHPDGTRVVVAVSRPDLGSDAYVGQLWQVDLPDGPPRRITRGRRDSVPQFSPDGTVLAFLRQVGTAPAQLVVMLASGGEPVAITDRPLGVDSFVWAPDSVSIAFLARAPESGRYGTVENLAADAEAPRHIVQQRYLSNGVGYITDRRMHVFQVQIPDVTSEPVYPSAPTLDDPHPAAPRIAPAERLTFGDVDYTALAFSPNSKQLAVVAARHDARDTDVRSDLHLLELSVLHRVDHDSDDLKSGDHGSSNRTRDDQGDSAPVLVPLTADQPARSIGALLWADNGMLYFLAEELGDSARDFIGRATSLYAFDASSAFDASTASVRRLTDRSTDLGELGSDLTLDGDSVLVQRRAHGRVQTLKIDATGAGVALGSPDVVVSGQSSASTRIIVTFAGPTTSGDLALVDGDTFTPITDFSSSLRESGILSAREISIVGRDGYPVHGWIMEPAGAGPHPVLLAIHGGPFAQYSVAVMDEFQVYADAGYAVVFCNPRGAAGYGEQHARSIRQAMGTVDFDDVIDFLEGALAQNTELDPSRLGVMGGSYGGYLTAWITAHDHRFAAAIVERGFLDPFSFVGTSDIGFFFGDEYAGTDAAALTAQSPMALVHQVSTPTFVIHSEDDLRCPLEQGQRYFAALKRRGVTTEMLIFPGENHELSRSGRPRHRQQRLDHILKWWARFLPTERNQPPKIDF